MVPGEGRMVPSSGRVPSPTRSKQLPSRWCWMVPHNNRESSWMVPASFEKVLPRRRMVPSTGKPGEEQMDPWMKARMFFRTQARRAEHPQQPRVKLDGSRTVRDGLTSMADGAQRREAWLSPDGSLEDDSSAFQGSGRTCRADTATK